MNDQISLLVVRGYLLLREPRRDYKQNELQALAAYFDIMYSTLGSAEAQIKRVADVYLQNSKLIDIPVNDRISRNQMFGTIASTIALRSTCLRKQVGAVIVRSGRIISTGYAGSPAGQPHCYQAGCILDNEGGCQRTIHAEANAIAFAARWGMSSMGSEMFVTLAPCLNCAKLIVNSGITCVKYIEDYRKTDGIDFLHQCGVMIEQLI